MAITAHHVMAIRQIQAITDHNWAIKEYGSEYSGIIFQYVTSSSIREMEVKIVGGLSVSLWEQW